LQSRPWSARRDGIARSVCQNEKLFGTEYTQILISLTRSHSSSGTLVKRWNEDPRVLEKVLHAVRLIADTADLVGTDPDKRPDDHQLDALKKAVGKPAEAIVDLVTGDRELLAVTERDVSRTPPSDSTAKKGRQGARC
jgi:hypothetical protein